MRTFALHSPLLDMSTGTLYNADMRIGVIVVHLQWSVTPAPRTAYDTLWRVLKLPLLPMSWLCVFDLMVQMTASYKLWKRATQVPF